MADSLSRGELADMYERSKAAMRRVRAEAEEYGEAVAMTVLEVTAGGAFGVAEEHFGERAIMGLNIPLVVGAGAAGAALFGVGGRGTMNAGLRAIGNAGLVVESYKKTTRMYREYRMQAETAAPQGGGT